MDEILKDAKDDFGGKAAKVNARTSTAPGEWSIISESSKSNGSGGIGAADLFDAVLIKAGSAARPRADKSRKGLNRPQADKNRLERGAMISR